MPSTKSNPKPKLSELPQPVHEWAFEAIGTRWWIGLYEAYDGDALQKIQHNVQTLIDRFDKTYSRFRTDSLVTAISQHAGVYQFSPDAEKLFDFYRKLYDVTDGAVTPLIGGLLSDAGYDANYSLQPGTLREVPAWDDVMEYREGVLTTRRPVLLDFGATGKGYLVDLVVEELLASGVQKYCVDAGGDMACYGLNGKLRVGLEHPADATQVIGVAEFSAGALCGSAGNRRAWANFTHIIDPGKKVSPKHLKAVWVYAQNALTADGLTTALYFADPVKLHATFAFEHCMMDADGTVSTSPGFPAQVFTKDTRGQRA